MFACITNIGNESPQVFAEQLTFNSSGETFNVWSFGGFIGPIGPFRAAVLSRKDNPLAKLLLHRISLHTGNLLS